MSGLRAAALELRAATIDDAERLLAWRNDLETRRASVNQDEVPSDAHIRWLTNVLADTDRCLLVGEIAGVPCGVIRLDGGQPPELNWTVSPAQRGRGVGKQLVAAAVHRFGGPLMARIRAENLGSQAIAHSAGFRLSDEQDAMQVWLLD